MFYLLFSPVSIRHILSDFLATNGEIIVPFVFISFFLFGGIAILKPNPSRTYFVIIIVIMLSTSALFAWTLYPFTHAHRYSSIADEQNSGYEIKIVMDNQEVLLDSRTHKPLRLGLGGFIVDAESKEERLEISEQVLSDADSLYESRQSLLSQLEHPPARAQNYWTGSEFNSSGFEKLRVYETTVIYKQNSHEVKKIDQDCIVSVNVSSEAVTEGCSYV